MKEQDNYSNNTTNQSNILQLSLQNDNKDNQLTNNNIQFNNFNQIASTINTNLNLNNIQNFTDFPLIGSPNQTPDKLNTNQIQPDILNFATQNNNNIYNFNNTNFYNNNNNVLNNNYYIAGNTNKGTKPFFTKKNVLLNAHSLNVINESIHKDLFQLEKFLPNYKQYISNNNLESINICLKYIEYTNFFFNQIVTNKVNDLLQKIIYSDNYNDNNYDNINNQNSQIYNIKKKIKELYKKLIPFDLRMNYLKDFYEKNSEKKLYTLFKNDLNKYQKDKDKIYYLYEVFEIVKQKMDIKDKEEIKNYFNRYFYNSKNQNNNKNYNDISSNFNNNMNNDKTGGNYTNNYNNYHSNIGNNTRMYRKYSYQSPNNQNKKNNSYYNSYENNSNYNNAIGSNHHHANNNYNNHNNHLNDDNDNLGYKNNYDNNNYHHHNSLYQRNNNNYKNSYSSRHYYNNNNNKNANLRNKGNRKNSAYSGVLVEIDSTPKKPESNKEEEDDKNINDNINNNNEKEINDKDNNINEINNIEKEEQNDENFNNNIYNEEQIDLENNLNINNENSKKENYHINEDEQFCKSDDNIDIKDENLLNDFNSINPFHENVTSSEENSVKDEQTNSSKNINSDNELINLNDNKDKDNNIDNNTDNNINNNKEEDSLILNIINNNKSNNIINSALYENNINNINNAEDSNNNEFKSDNQIEQIEDNKINIIEEKEEIDNKNKNDNKSTDTSPKSKSISNNNNTQDVNLNLTNNNSNSFNNNINHKNSPNNQNINNNNILFNNNLFNNNLLFNNLTNEQLQLLKKIFMVQNNNNNIIMNMNSFQNQQSQKNNFMNNPMSNNQINNNLNNINNFNNNLNLFNNNINLFNNNYYYQNNHQNYNNILFNYWSDENNLLSIFKKNSNNNKSNYHINMNYIKNKSENLSIEYNQIKSLEKANPSIREEYLNLFEEKIILPVYAEINKENQEKKEFYTEIYNKYKNIITNVLSKHDLKDTLVKPYGSIVNNFMTEWGDIDICIIPKDNSSINNYLEYLEEIKEEAVNNQKIACCNIMERYQRFLILKIKDIKTNIDLDITVQNILPILNTNLIRLYSLLDQRFHILGTFLKFWVKKNHIHGALDKYLSSYALLLLIIHYLQNIAEPKILPILQEIQNIQKEYIYYFEGKELKTNLYFEEDLEKINNYMSIINDKNENKNSVIELLVGFFEFYAYKYNHYLISISHSDKKPVAEDEIIAFPLEDPFDINYNPGKSLKLNTLQYYAFIYCMKKELNNILSGEYFKFVAGE